MTPPRPLQSDGRLHGIIVGCPHPHSEEGDNRWLMIRRSEHVIAPLKLCFPGGAAEVNEPHEAAAHREMREELDAEIHSLQHVWTCEIQEKSLTLFGYLARLTHDSFTPDPREVAEVLWLLPHEIEHHPDTLPRTHEFVAALLAADKQVC